MPPMAVITGTVSWTVAAVDARNAGSRYDLVVATMILIGLIGILLDFLIRRLEVFDEVRWGYTQR